MVIRLKSKNSLPSYFLETISPLAISAITSKYQAFDFSAIPQYHITKISIKSDSCMRCKISQKDDHCKNVSNDRVFTNKDLPFSSRT